MPDNFEAKLFLEVIDSKNILIGLTNNDRWEDDSLQFVDDIWVLKPLTGEKYSSKKGIEQYLKTPAKEKDFILITKIKDEIFFRINYDLTRIAYKLEKNFKNNLFYIYLENEQTLSRTRINFVYVRKI